MTKQCHTFRECLSNALSSAVFVFSLVLPEFAYSQVRDPTAVRPGVEIIEVFVAAIDEVTGEEKTGRGWAFTDSKSDAQRCLVITPWHVVGRIEPHKEIYISGPGSDQEPSATVLHEALTFYNADITVLRIGRNNPCPFEALADELQKENGLHLLRTRTSGVGIESIELNRDAGLLPASNDGVVWTVRADAEYSQSVMKGWSGASVVLDGVRIGMATSIPPNRNEVNFVSVAGMQWLFGERLDLVNPGPGYVANKARSEIVRLGISFSAAGLREALIGGDEFIIQLFETAGVPGEVVESALKVKPADLDFSVATYFFRAAKNTPALVEWFRARLDEGLDPNLVIEGEVFKEEAILSVAIRVGSSGIIRALLEAGASPHPVQNLIGRRNSTPHFLNPLAAVAEHRSMSYDERSAIADALLDSGAPLPDLIPRLPDGSIEALDLKQRGRSIDRDYQEPLNKLGLERTPTPDLCERSPEEICSSAQENYGVDWCKLIDALPKGFSGRGEGAHRVPPMVLQHLLAINNNNAYFLGKIQNLYSSTHEEYRIVKVSRDESTVEVMARSSNYDCDLGENETGKGYCWQSATFHRRGDTEEYKRTGSWAGSFQFYDLCELAAESDKAFEERKPDTSWVDSLRDGVQLLNETTRGLIRYSAGPISQESRKWLHFDLAEFEVELNEMHNRRNKDQDEEGWRVDWTELESVNRKTVFAREMFYGETSPDGEYPERSESSSKKTLSLGVPARTHDNAIPDFDPTAALVVDELMSFASENIVPETLALITDLPPLQYDEERGEMVNVSRRQREIGEMRIAPPIAQPYYVGDELPERGQYIVIVPDRGQEYDLMSAQFSRVQRLTRERDPLLGEKEERLISWQPDFKNSMLDIQVLALDRIVTFDGFPVAKEEALRLAETWSSGRSRSGNWRLVSIVENRGAKALMPRNITTLFADLKEVLLISPNDELVGRYSAEIFPKIPEVEKLEVNMSKPEPLKSPMPLMAETIDFLVARYRPDLMTGKFLYGMIVSRWVYEKEAVDLIGGRFFASTHFLPSERNFRRLLPEFADWLMEHGRSLPSKLVVPTRRVRDRAGDVWSHLLLDKDSCVQALSENRQSTWSASVHDRYDQPVATLVSGLRAESCGGSMQLQNVRDGHVVETSEGAISAEESRIGLILDLESPSSQLSSEPQSESNLIEIEILGSSDMSDFVGGSFSRENVRLLVKAKLGFVNK